MSPQVSAAPVRLLFCLNPTLLTEVDLVYSSWFALVVVIRGSTQVFCHLPIAHHAGSTLL